MTRRHNRGEPRDLVDFFEGPEGARIKEGYDITDTELDALEDEVSLFEQSFQVEDSLFGDNDEGIPEADRGETLAP